MTERQRLRLAGRLHGIWQSRAGPDPSAGEWGRLELKFGRELRSCRRNDLARSAELILIQPDLRSELLASLVALDQHVNFLREHIYMQVEQDNPETPLTFSHYHLHDEESRRQMARIQIGITAGMLPAAKGSVFQPGVGREGSS